MGQRYREKELGGGEECYFKTRITYNSQETIASLKRKDKGWEANSNRQKQNVQGKMGWGRVQEVEGPRESATVSSQTEGDSNVCLLPPFQSPEDCLAQTHPACVFDGEAMLHRC